MHFIPGTQKQFLFLFYLDSNILGVKWIWKIMDLLAASLGTGVFYCFLLDGTNLKLTVERTWSDVTENSTIIIAHGRKTWSNVI